MGQGMMIGSNAPWAEGRSINTIDFAEACSTADVADWIRIDFIAIYGSSPAGLPAADLIEGAHCYCGIEALMVQAQQGLRQGAPRLQKQQVPQKQQKLQAATAAVTVYSDR